MPEIANFMEQVWESLRVVDLFDIALVATVLYIAFVWIRRRVSRAVVLGLGVVILAYAAAQLFDLYLTTMVFRVGVTFLLFGLILVFQDDIRRLFERLRAFRFGRREQSTTETWTYLDEIVDAVEQMSDQTIGALIVIKRNESIAMHTSGGVELDGEISRPLLMSIFDPYTDGHDGAVIIDDARIESFGVHLPLTTDDTQLGAGGTRHAAALGLAERSDALILVVSEETGTISLGREGRLEPVESRADLNAKLAEEFDLQDESTPPPFWKRWFTHNLGLKGASLLLAAVLWFVLANQITPIQRTYTVPIEYRNVPKQLAIEQETSQARLEIVGPERAFRRLKSDTLAVSIDVSGAEPGTRHFVLSGDQVVLPNELSIRDIEPSRVSATLFRLVETKLPVAVRTVGSPPSGREVEQISARPGAVTVRVRKALKNRITEIPTVPIDLSELEKSTTVETALVPLPNVRWPEEFEGKVEVKIKLAPDDRDTSTGTGPPGG